MIRLSIEYHCYALQCQPNCDEPLFGENNKYEMIDAQDDYTGKN